jgi:hypothetical protein
MNTQRTGIDTILTFIVVTFSVCFSSAQDTCSLIDSITLRVSNEFVNIASINRLIGSSCPVDFNEWNYIVMTKDNVNGGKIYKNGKLVFSGSFQNVPYFWERLDLGAEHYTSWSFWYKGLIDEVRISNKVRAATEIMNNYNASAPFSADQSTIGLWHFDEGSGSSINGTVGPPGMIIDGAWDQGIFGTCVSYNGISTRVSFPFPNQIPNNNVTVEFWIKPFDNQMIQSRPVNLNGLFTTGLIIDTLRVSPIWSTGETGTSVTVDPDQVPLVWVTNGNCSDSVYFNYQNSVVRDTIKVFIKDTLKIKFLCSSVGHVNVSGSIKTETQDGVGGISVTLDGSVNTAMPFNQSITTDNDGIYEFVDIASSGSNFSILPEKNDNPLNGVTTYDLLLISRHILGIEPLGSTYKIIAADANKSNSVTTFDVVELRKLILGIYDKLPNCDSWRFIDRSQVFVNPLNPFTGALKESISVLNAQSNQMADFIGLKVGDVNNSAVPNSIQFQFDNRTKETLLFDIQDRLVKAGDVFDVTFMPDQAVLAYQMTLILKDLEVLNIIKTDRIDEKNFGLYSDAITVSVDTSCPFTITFRAVRGGILSEMLRLSSRITRTEGYGVSSEVMDVALRFSQNRVQAIGFELYQNKPNPVYNNTVIEFHLPTSGNATLSFLDITGRLISEINADFSAGYSSVVVDAGLFKSNKVIFYRLTHNNQNLIRKMNLVNP